MARLFNGFSEEKLEEIINGYFNGQFTTRNLPVDVYNASVERINQGLFGGFGGSLTDFEDLSSEKELLKFFDHNVQRFSAAKTYQEARDLTNALFDADGFKRSFADFQKDAAKITAVYNEAWLRTEFDTASNMGLSGRQWLDAERDKEIAPLLRYETVGDERVRPEHINLDGIIKPVDDPFWNTNYPPNGWNCRCIVEQLFEGEQPITPNKDLPPVDEIPPLFQMNPGRDKILFSESKHPFFNVPKADVQFKKESFGLPVGPKPIAAPKSLTEPFKPGNYEDLLGVDMGTGFFSLLKKPTNLRLTKTEGSYHLATREGSNVVINVKRYPTKEMQKQIIAHEFGHAIHNQQNWLVEGFFDNVIDSDFEKVFKRWQKLTGLGARGAKRQAIWNDLNARLSNQSFVKTAEKLDLNPNNKGVIENWHSTNDVIAALTTNKFGYGHKTSYFKRSRGMGSRKEFFAHASEFYFVGNPMFKELFPEMYAEMRQLMKLLIEKAE